MASSLFYTHLLVSTTGFLQIIQLVLRVFCFVLFFSTVQVVGVILFFFCVGGFTSNRKY